MAVAAETMQYQFADSIPELADARQAVRDEAEQLLESRRAAQKRGEPLEILQIDALSTAHKVLEAESLYGADSSEHAERSRGLLLDCERLVAEWYRKLRPEYFPPVRHIFDESAGEFFSHGLSVAQMTFNALTPIGNDEEEARRVNERVEDATPQLVRSLGTVALGQKIRTISECPDSVIKDFNDDAQTGSKHRGYAGYVPEIEKLMLRDISLDTDTNDRFEEQISLPGIFINHEIIAKALELRGAHAAHLGKTELHGAQLLVQDDLMDFVRTLDEVASSEWSTTIFMGEAVEREAPRDYDAFRAEALARQAGLKDLAHTVAHFVLELASDNIDRTKAPAKVEEFVKMLLLNLGKQQPELIEDMFNAKTAQGIREVIRLEQLGQYERAMEQMEAVMEAAPGGGFCGAGSCGIEAINRHSAEGKDIAKKLKAEAGDTIVRDTERACKCGKKSIVYAYNGTKVNKYCQGCGSFESKRSVVKAK